MATKMVEINCTTGEIVERAMTKEEISVEKKLQSEAKKVNAEALAVTTAEEIAAL